jgi:hypothetical protein
VIDVVKDDEPDPDAREKLEKELVILEMRRSVQYRSRAEQARQQAQRAADDATRKILLNDAALWERMADYEEKNNPPS